MHTLETFATPLTLTITFALTLVAGCHAKPPTFRPHLNPPSNRTLVDNDVARARSGGAGSAPFELSDDLVNNYADPITRTDQCHENLEPIVIAGSGGGTRSALFTYGALLALGELEVDCGESKRNLVEEIDYFSTVSGSGVGVASFAKSGLCTAQNTYEYPPLEARAWDQETFGLARRGWAWKPDLESHQLTSKPRSQVIRAKRRTYGHAIVARFDRILFGRTKAFSSANSSNSAVLPCHLSDGCGRRGQKNSGEKSITRADPYTIAVNAPTRSIANGSVVERVQAREPKRPHKSGHSASISLFFARPNETARWPIWILNSTLYGTGQRFPITPGTLRRMGAMHYTFHRWTHVLLDGYDFPAAEALKASAGFPIFRPSQLLDSGCAQHIQRNGKCYGGQTAGERAKYLLIDGGVADNTGLRTAMDITDAIKKKHKAARPLIIYLDATNAHSHPWLSGHQVPGSFKRASGSWWVANQYMSSIGLRNISDVYARCTEGGACSFVTAGFYSGMPECGRGTYTPNRGRTRGSCREAQTFIDDKVPDFQQLDASVCEQEAIQYVSDCAALTPTSWGLKPARAKIVTLAGYCAIHRQSDTILDAVRR